MVTLAQEGALVKAQDIDINDLPMDVATYYFDIITQHSISLQSQITDNWMENNSVINDHIANQPITITLSGLKGELSYVPNDTTTLAYLSMAEYKTETKLINKLGKLASLYPPIDNVTQIAINIKDYVVASYNRYKGIVNTLFRENNYSSTFNLLSIYNRKPISYDHPKIRNIYNRFETMRIMKLPFEVATPYKTFKNMYIQSLALRQGNQLFTTDIEVTFKQVNFVETLTTTADEKVVADIQAAQRAEIENHGNTQGSRKSLAAQMWDGDRLNIIGD